METKKTQILILPTPLSLYLMDLYRVIIVSFLREHLTKSPVSWEASFSSDVCLTKYITIVVFLIFFLCVRGKKANLQSTKSSRICFWLFFFDLLCFLPLIQQAAAQQAQLVTEQALPVVGGVFLHFFSRIFFSFWIFFLRFCQIFMPFRLVCRWMGCRGRNHPHPQGQRARLTGQWCPPWGSHQLQSTKKGAIHYKCCLF